MNPPAARNPADKASQTHRDGAGVSCPAHRSSASIPTPAATAHAHAAAARHPARATTNSPQASSAITANGNQTKISIQSQLLHPGAAEPDVRNQSMEKAACVKIQNATRSRQSTTLVGLSSMRTLESARSAPVIGRSTSQCSLHGLDGFQG